jgi:hypothetical protein
VIEVDILRGHRRENLKSYKIISLCLSIVVFATVVLPVTMFQPVTPCSPAGYTEVCRRTLPPSPYEYHHYHDDEYYFRDLNQAISKLQVTYFIACLTLVLSWPTAKIVLVLIVINAL